MEQASSLTAKKRVPQALEALEAVSKFLGAVDIAFHAFYPVTYETCVVRCLAWGCFECCHVAASACSLCFIARHPSLSGCSAAANLAAGKPAFALLGEAAAGAGDAGAGSVAAADPMTSGSESGDENAEPLSNNKRKKSA